MDSSSAGGYRWWRAEAWAGKTALLATFVLDPPPGVHVVSFFVTARLANQNDRTAFVDTLLAQLCGQLGVPAPHEGSVSTREARMVELLDEVARRYRDGGEHFALVVDGLDEDRGVDGTADAHSIAALLPAEPPHGMRVIVSGRPSPPIPFDVPENHPLRDPGIVRVLVPSALAAAQRVDMERDLIRLLKDPIGRDLLGFLAAAGGGLTTVDLATVAKTSEWEVRTVLRTVAGRSFAQRVDSVEVHQLAHQGLHALATEHLGSQLDGYRERLYAWAQGYAEAHWPPNTPDCLYRGYFTALASVGHLDGMIACATDPHRHRRLRARTGGDAAALAEITETQDRVLAAERPDLVTLARLAVHRTHLWRGASQIPTTLPAGWARLGDLDRAMAMIEALPDTRHRIDALLATERVCRSMGHAEEAQALLDQAIELAAGFNQYFGGRAVGSVVEAVAEAGDLDRAAEIADSLIAMDERAEAFAFLACHAHKAGDSTRSDRFLARAEGSVHDQSTSAARARGALAVAAARIGRPAMASRLLDEAEFVLSTHVAGRPEGEVGIPRDADLGRNAGQLARYAAQVGEYDRAFRLITVTEEEYRAQWLDGVIAITATHDVISAERMARTATEPTTLCSNLATLACTVARQATDQELVARLLAEIHDIAEGLTDQGARAAALMSVAEAVAENGDPARAVLLVREAVELGTDAEAVMSVARATFRAGDLDRVADLLALAEDLARGSLSEYDERRSVQWIRTMADFRDFDRAERLASSFADHTARAAAWAAIAEGALAADELDRAEQALSLIEDVDLQRRPRRDLIGAVLAAGDTGRAGTLAREAATTADRVSALVLVAQTTRNDDLLADAERMVDQLKSNEDQVNMMLVLIEATATLRFRDRVTSQLERLRQIAQDVPDDSAETDLVTAFAMARMRTMTEVAERASCLHSRPFLAADPLAGLIPAASFPSKPDRPLAVRLSAEDWTHAVEELVSHCPQAYPTIVAELDTIAGALVLDNSVGPSAFRR